MLESHCQDKLLQRHIFSTRKHVIIVPGYTEDPRTSH